MSSTASIQFAGGNSHAVATFLLQRKIAFRAETHPGDATQDLFFIWDPDAPEGAWPVVDNDWIVVDTEGGAYPCKPQVYAALHDHADESTSDGFHDFAALYRHRNALWLALAARVPGAWKSRNHETGANPMYPEMFVAGADLPTGAVAYHLPDDLWDACPGVVLDHAPHYDGYTPGDVVDRLILDAAADRHPTEPIGWMVIETNPATGEMSNDWDGLVHSREEEAIRECANANASGDPDGEPGDDWRVVAVYETPDTRPGTR